jgi:NADH:ubiquinone oxidoreductase subunit 6 (subunit J)
MVMFLFVIAYIGHRADEPFAGGRSLARVAAIVAGAALLIEIVVVIVQDAGGRLSDTADITGAFGSPSEIGTLFLTDHLLAFEVTSIILLVGAVGGVVLGSGTRRRKGNDGNGDSDPAGEPELSGNGRNTLSAVERPGGPRSRPTEAA